MRSLFFKALLLAVLVAAVAQADTIYLKSGKTIPAENVQVTADKVIFNLHGGKMSISKNLVLRIERNDLTFESTGGFRSSISGTPYRNPVSAGADGRRAGGGEGGTDDASSQRADTLQNFINIKLQLQRDLQFAESQIQTLRSVIYAKAAINSDTEEERRRLTEFEQRKQTIEAQLTQLMNEARRGGLLPVDLRELEQASITNQPSNSQNNTITLNSQPAQNKDPRDANIKMIDDDDVDESRVSGTVLDEEDDNPPIDQ